VNCPQQAVFRSTIEKAVKASEKFSAEARTRAARLSWRLTLGAPPPGGGVAGRMLGGGCHDGAKPVVRALTLADQIADYAWKSQV